MNEKQLSAREAQPEVQADFRLDLRGEVCPHPVLFSLQQLERMRPGQVLEIVADCPAAFVNVPVEVVRHGHRLLQEPRRQGAEILILVEAAAPRPPSAAPVPQGSPARGCAAGKPA